MSDLLKKEFLALCRLGGQYNRVSGPVRSSSQGGQRIVRHLYTFAKAASMALSADAGGLDVTVSRGISNLPKILWVAFLLPYNRVSTNLSVTTCFGKHGEGAVLGLMLPCRLDTRKGLEALTREQIQVDVSGVKNDYNDKFVNPREFLIGTFSPDAYIEHARASIELLRSTMDTKGKA